MVAFGGRPAKLSPLWSGRSVAWLARLNGVQKVVSSNLTVPTIFPLLNVRRSGTGGWQLFWQHSLLCQPGLGVSETPPLPLALRPPDAPRYEVLISVAGRISHVLLLVMMTGVVLLFLAARWSGAVSGQRCLTLPEIAATAGFSPQPADQQWRKGYCARAGKVRGFQNRPKCSGREGSCWGARSASALQDASGTAALASRRPRFQ